ncbi:hypothetical protein BKH42_03190 [Helicobacter sp. 13S00482-2]|uniref:hypothetical protein n=1 Tax=Helicobacter sp. 13S00482-2 TaxID=1476200 RepID=UPI000BA5DED9|nr:hypothetical protein [Helicobacter sp. 13S00482-2]PAF53985.1 hypothetical protein BKH42_03190 [Helicobacter sp. 13S00482-2]
MKRILLFLMFLILGNLDADQRVYAQSVKSLYLSPESTKVVGRLLPTSEVSIIKKSGNRVLLSISGYIIKNTDNAIYFLAGKRILTAGLVKNSGAKFKIISSMKDKTTDTVYQKITTELWSDEENLISDLESIYKRANELYSTNCSSCHSAHNPKEYKANQWPSVIKSMIGRTGLSKDEGYLIIEYMQKHANDIK